MSSQIQTCLVCDMIRPELNGKLIILGFFGICPNVHITLAALDRPTPLTFLLSGRANAGQLSVALQIVDVQSQHAIASTLEIPISVEGAGGVFNVVQTLLLTFGRAGDFEARCFVNGVKDYSGFFRVARADSELDGDI